MAMISPPEDVLDGGQFSGPFGGQGGGPFGRQTMRLARSIAMTGTRRRGGAKMRQQ
jgi:hypothetical protein